MNQSYHCVADLLEKFEIKVKFPTWILLLCALQWLSDEFSFLWMRRNSKWHQPGSESVGLQGPRHRWHQRNIHFSKKNHHYMSSERPCQYFQTSDAIVLTSTLTPYAYPHFASELIHPLSGKIPAKVIYPLEKFCACTWSQSKEMDNGHKRHETLVQMTKCTLWRWINFGRFQELSMD